MTRINIIGGMQGSEFLICFICFGVPAIIVFLIVKNIQNKKRKEPQKPIKDDAQFISEQVNQPLNDDSERADIKSKLQEYDAMKNKGLISEDDYEELKRKLLDL